MKLTPIKALRRWSKVEKLESCPKGVTLAFRQSTPFPFRRKAADEGERRLDQPQPDRVVAVCDRPRAHPPLHRAPRINIVRRKRPAVASTVHESGAPEAALVGVDRRTH